MQNPSIFYISLLLNLILPSLSFADLKVILTREADLPSYLTPAALPHHQKHSVPRTSSAKKTSFPEKALPADSADRLAEIPYGDPDQTRLLLARNGRFFAIGGYVEQPDGTIDLYTVNGKQVIYSPAKTDALYSSQDNAFCGSMIKFGKTKVIALTEQGRTAFEKEGINLSTPSDQRKHMPSKKRPGGLNRHCIQENIQQGRMIVLDNGSIWKINPADKPRVGQWKPASPIAITPTNENRSGYDHLLIHINSGTKVKAKFMGKE